MRLKDIVAIICNTRILPINGSEYLYWDGGSKNRKCSVRKFL